MAEEAVKIDSIIAILDVVRGLPGHVQQEHIGDIVAAHRLLLRSPELNRDTYDRAMHRIILSPGMLFDIVEWSASREHRD